MYQIMLLHTLPKNTGNKKKGKDLWRGNGSWAGNYSGRGHKGQWARSWAKLPWWFEGGQTPLVQRLPKMKGFKRHYKLIDKVSVVNLDRLNQDDSIKSGETINPAFLIEKGYARENHLIKVLWRGDLAKKLSFEGITLFSAKAKEAIEKAGGSIA